VFQHDTFKKLEVCPSSLVERQIPLKFAKLAGLKGGVIQLSGYLLFVFTPFNQQQLANNQPFVPAARVATFYAWSLELEAGG